MFWSIKPATTFAARRRTVYLFHDGSDALSGKPNPLVWVDNTPQVWTDLRNILALYNPPTIALNIDPDFAFADGMHAGELERISEQLGEKWMSRVVKRPMLAIEFVARRIPEQLEYYKALQEMAWAMVTEAFSERTVTPGVTTTDVRNFHPSALTLPKALATTNYSGRRLVVPRPNAGTQRIDMEHAQSIHLSKIDAASFQHHRGR